MFTSICALKNINNTIICEQELSEIDYQPKNCAYAYLKKLSIKLRTLMPLFWDFPDRGLDTVMQFQADNNLVVAFIDAMGKSFAYPGSQSAGTAKAHPIERTYALGESFELMKTLNGPVYAYTTVFRKSNGEIIIPFISTNVDGVFKFC